MYAASHAQAHGQRPTVTFLAVCTQAQQLELLRIPRREEHLHVMHCTRSCVCLRDIKVVISWKVRLVIG
jgi:hypothetical protein